MKTIYLICGVSGSGKTWLCKQLDEKFAYIPHDLYYDKIYYMASKHFMQSTKPVITESPFGERIIREKFEQMGFKVIPVFVIEDADLIADRYFKREGKPIQKAAYTRASTIMNRALEWNAFHGTSNEVLKYLQNIGQ